MRVMLPPKLAQESSLALTRNFGTNGIAASIYLDAQVVQFI